MRLVLAEDSVLLRECVARILDEAGFEVVGQAGNADELMTSIRADPRRSVRVDPRSASYYNIRAS